MWKYLTLLSLILTAQSFGISGEPFAFNAESSYGDADEFTLENLRLDGAFSLNPNFFTQLDAAYGKLDNLQTKEFGLSVYLQGKNGQVGVRLAFNNFSGLHNWIYECQAQVFAAPFYTVAFMYRFDRKAFGPDMETAGISFRLYPYPNLMIQSGIGSDRLHDRATSEEIGATLGAEWAPGVLRKRGLSLFGEIQASETRVLGMRFRMGKGKDLRTKHRTQGLFRLAN